MKVSLNPVLLLAFVAPTVIDSQCVTCPGGIENPGADASGFGLYTCEEADSLYSFLQPDDAACLGAQFQVAPICCPSLIPELGKNNSCGWCPNGLPDPFATFSLPGETDELTCLSLMSLAATGAGQVPGVCDLVTSAADTCCPGDSSGVGYVCQFCTGGVDFPDKTIEVADNQTCSMIQQFSGFFNQSLCEESVLPLISECCPNSSTDPPAATNPPTSGATISIGPACEFCPLGIETTDVALPFVDGIEGVTCEDFRVSAIFVSAEVCAKNVKPLEGLCCPSTTTVEGCDWCPNGVENPDVIFPVVDLPCSQIGMLSQVVTTDDLCNNYKQAESVCCPETVGAVTCDFCSGPEGLEFPDKEVSDSGVTCSDFATFATGAPDEEYCEGLSAAQALCCPASTGVSLPPVAEGEYCYICGDASTEMTKPDYQPYAVLGSNDPDDLVTCAEIEQLLNEERGEEESCASVLTSFTLVFSSSICGCAGVEPPNPCKFCDGRSVKRDVVLPEEDGLTCGQGYDLLLHFTSDLRCDAPNTSFEDAEKLCCGDAEEKEKTSTASSIGIEIFVVFVSLVVVVVV